MDDIVIIFAILAITIVVVIAVCLNRGNNSSEATRQETGASEMFFAKGTEEFLKKQELKKEMVDRTVSNFSDIGWDEWDESVHCSEDQINRMRRAVEPNSFDLVCYNPDTQNAKIRSKSRKCYLTSSHRCSCPDFRRRGLPCKHMYFLSYVIPNYKELFPNIKKGNSLKGLNFCICGRGQDAVKEYISQHGGSVENIYVMETSAVVLASPVESSVVATAREYDMEILTFEELKSLFPDYSQTLSAHKNTDRNEDNAVDEEQEKYSEDKHSTNFAGMTFVFTGTLPNLSREEAAKLVNNAGGKVSGSVSSKTTYLVAGEDCGTKLEMAKALDISIIGEEEFLALFKDRN